jgi:DNA repair exonuclease SbcCD ATPase subunit
MHIRRISIKNIRSIDEIEWKLPEASSAPGWHVIIGDNGAGKTSFLRSIALALIGPAEPGALRQDWRSWLRNKGEEPAQISLLITHVSAPVSWTQDKG